MANAKKPIILICDDEEGIRESLKLILEDHYALIVTEGGAQAIEVITHDKDKTIAVAFLDIKMPKIHGLEVLKMIKEKRADLPVIMVTGYRSVETASEAAKLGAQGYIVKPFNSEEIRAAVRRYIK